MQTRLSTKGQIVLPGTIRQKLGLKPGDALDASIEGHRVVLTPSYPRTGEARIIPHPVTGFPVLAVDGDVPPLTSEQVAEILAEFP